jgi:hypothetical protein
MSKTNWLFALAITILLLMILSVSVSVPGTKTFLSKREVHDRQSQNKTPEGN